MDEAAWLSRTDPTEMLSCLSRSGASTRKIRLFAVACCRHHWNLLGDPRSRNAPLAAELWADNHLSSVAIHQARAEAESAARDAPSPAAWSAVWTLNHDPWTAAFQTARHTPTTIQSHILLDLFGNPFRSVNVEQSWLKWNDHTVVRLAQGMYQDCSFDRLPILADALEDAGCTDRDILIHCRQGGNHAKGCWVIDLLTGRGQETLVVDKPGRCPGCGSPTEGNGVFCSLVCEIMMSAG